MRFRAFNLSVVKNRPEIETRRVAERPGAEPPRRGRTTKDYVFSGREGAIPPEMTRERIGPKSIFGQILSASFALLSVCGCGSPPPPQPAPEPHKQEETRARSSRPVPQVSQELGSIDARKVEQTFAGLVAGPLEECHKQGRDRIEFLTGEVKVFLRIDTQGKVKYGFLEETTLGDRATEKCILGVLGNAHWPRPEGGEAEVRSGFGWGSAGEREPTTWPSDKITRALVEAKDVRSQIGRCRAGARGDLSVTAYVEVEEEEAKPKPSKKGHKAVGGKFKAIGISAKSKEVAEAIDCVVDALKALELPSPGSYAAKVTFSL